MATYLKIENPGVCPTEGFIAGILSQLSDTIR
jgi:hypothetical protein